MSFYQEILPFTDFLVSIRKLENYLSFDMSFPSKWNLPKSIVDEKKVVGFKTTDENFKGVSFVSSIDETEVKDTLTSISKVIKINKEKEIKEKLFKQTVEELRKTFEKTDLDKLQNLYFDFSSDIEDTTNLDSYDAGQSETIELVEE